MRDCDEVHNRDHFIEGIEHAVDARYGLKSREFVSCGSGERLKVLGVGEDDAVKRPGIEHASQDSDRDAQMTLVKIHPGSLNATVHEHVLLDAFESGESSNQIVCLDYTVSMAGIEQQIGIEAEVARVERFGVIVQEGDELFIRYKGNIELHLCLLPMNR